MRRRKEGGRDERNEGRREGRKGEGRRVGSKEGVKKER